MRVRLSLCLLLLFELSGYSRAKTIPDLNVYHDDCMKRSIQIFGDKGVMTQKKLCICEYELGRQELFLSVAPG